MQTEKTKKFTLVCINLFTGRRSNIVYLDDSHLSPEAQALKSNKLQKLREYKLEVKAKKAEQLKAERRARRKPETKPRKKNFLRRSQAMNPKYDIDGNEIERKCFVSFKPKGFRGKGNPLNEEDFSNDNLRKFLDMCEENELVPTIDLIAQFLGVTSDAIVKRAKRDPELSKAIQFWKECVHTNKLDQAYKGNINPTIFMFDAKNNHGMRDKIDVEEKSDKTVRIIIDDFDAPDDSIKSVPDYEDDF